LSFNIVKIKLFFILGFVLLYCGFCSGQNVNLEEVISFIHTPSQLSGWLIKEFNYRGEFPDYWQSAQQTLELKGGDCEDFAILSHAILTELGIENNIVLVKFRDLRQFHALCIFKDKGAYSFISNQKLIRTKATSIEQAIEKIYPDWE